MRQAEFAELSREVMPVLDKLTEIAGQHGTAEKLVSITLSAEVQYPRITKNSQLRCIFSGLLSGRYGKRSHRTDRPAECRNRIAALKGFRSEL